MNSETFIEIYYFMCLTRAMEDRTRTLFLQGRVVGGVYTAQVKM
jgi:TPP-dependent pyruvate/acetoin dehydrogenase alpha subunit